MKKILMPIKSEEVYMILNGVKTIKILKTAPKCDLPIEVYIYCTKSAPYLHLWKEPATVKPGGPKGTNKVTWKTSWRLDKTKWYMPQNEKIVASFTLKKVEELKPFSFMKMLGNGLTEKLNEIADKADMGWLGIHKYANGKSVYLWYIDDLEIFDEPKELSIHAPQSWCYVEEVQ